MNDTETSIRAVIECVPVGRIVTMGFPGLLTTFDGAAHIDPDAMGATLNDIRLANCGIMIALAERDELPDGALQMLEEALSRRAIAFAHMPIVDYAAPAADFEALWATKAAEFHRLLAEGGTIGISCHYGAGRSGTIAAHLLIERGAQANEAVAAVRDAFAESIESEAQLSWLKAQRPTP